MTVVFSAICCTITSGSCTSVMITSEIATPCGMNWSLSERRMSAATSAPLAVAAAAWSWSLRRPV